VAAEAGCDWRHGFDSGAGIGVSPHRPHLTASSRELEKYSAARGRVLAQCVDAGLAQVLVLGEWPIWVSTRDTGVAACLSRYGYYESWVTVAIARYLRPGMYCVDVGANYGYFTALMAGLVGVTGRVLAVEPNPDLAQMLAATVALNGWHPQVGTAALAAWSESGVKKTLVVDPGDTGAGSIMVQATPGSQQYVVEAVTLDDLLQDWPRVDFVKVDAEGSELHIWRGMHDTLQRNPQCVVALEVSNERGYDSAAFYQSVAAEGYLLAEVTSTGDIAPATVSQMSSQLGYGQWTMLWLGRASG